MRAVATNKRRISDCKFPAVWLPLCHQSDANKDFAKVAAPKNQRDGLDRSSWGLFFYQPSAFSHASVQRCGWRAHKELRDISPITEAKTTNAKKYKENCTKAAHSKTKDWEPSRLLLSFSICLVSVQVTNRLAISWRNLKQVLPMSERD